MTFNDLPMCILQYITDKYLKFYDVMNILKINKKCNRIKIKDLCDISYHAKCKLTNEILKKYKHIEKLQIPNNLKISNVNYMINLKTLHAHGSDCGINDDGIKNLINLEYLDVFENQKITNVNHMINLKILHAHGNCGINNDSIKNLINLEYLNATNNPKITIKLKK